ncbi:MAG: hypothetical protein ABIK84_00375 [candidate division WOR-3 bacterium]|nr:hypothetical protein [Candidatus Omnitrophota bacterium]
MRTFWFIVLGILVFGVIVWLVSSDFVPNFASRSKPEGVEGKKWNDFFLVLFSFVFIVSLVSFYLYATTLYKLLRIDNYPKVFKLGKPWIWGMILVFILLIIIGLLSGIAALPEKSLILILLILAFSGLGGLLGMVVYWIFTLFYSPPKVKYAPPFRLQIVDLFRKIGGGKQ